MSVFRCEAAWIADTQTDESGAHESWVWTCLPIGSVGRNRFELAHEAGGSNPPMPSRSSALPSHLNAFHNEVMR